MAYGNRMVACSCQVCCNFLTHCNHDSRICMSLFCLTPLKYIYQVNFMWLLLNSAVLLGTSSTDLQVTLTSPCNNHHFQVDLPFYV